MILIKIIGAGCILFGFFLVVLFPDAPQYQSPSMAWTAVFFGVFLIALGIYLLKA
ncbi:MAG: hypothetical protein QMD36_04500 [Candidatus Aenigmarchaeota archaeon]|nr:hypothetical protein [Candidatus Aenigmarchaeota archaeon]